VTIAFLDVFYYIIIVNLHFYFAVEQLKQKKNNNNHTTREGDLTLSTFVIFKILMNLFYIQ